MRTLLQERLERALRTDAEVQNRVQELENEVRAGRLTPALAAGQLATLMGVRSCQRKAATCCRLRFQCGRCHESAAYRLCGHFQACRSTRPCALVPQLAERAKSCFVGAKLIAGVLPTEWLAAPRQMEILLAQARPDLILHFGVSARARGFEIEQRGQNRCLLAPDAGGAFPVSTAVYARRAGDPARQPAGQLHRRPPAPAGYPCLRLPRRGRLSVQCHALSFARHGPRPTRTPRRLYSRPGKPGAAGRSRARALECLPADLGAGARGWPGDPGGVSQSLCGASARTALAALPASVSPGL